MTTSQKGIDLIKSFEGYRAYAYRDQGGVLTIGYGHTKDVKEDDTCDEAKATEWLKEDLAIAERCVNSQIMGNLLQHQFDALVSWTFNLGCGNLFNSTLRRKLNAGDMYAAADELVKWNKVAGRSNVGLTNRRLLEQKMFLGDSE